MRMNNADYKQYADSFAPSSKTGLNLLKAFCIGGLICVLGEALLSLFAYLGFDKEESGTLNCISLIFLSALLTALHLYDNIAKHAGAGTLVPITGFANAVVSPAVEFKPEGLVMGVGAKIFSIVGPVVAYGVIASVIAGICYYLGGLM